MILTCFWCERPFDSEPTGFPVYCNDPHWVDLCRHCLDGQLPSVSQLIHKVETDPLIYAMEKANDTQHQNR